MRSHHLRAAWLGHAVLFASRLVVADDAGALWMQPSGNWYGIDGTWSSFSFGVGAPLQQVDLGVSTALSEIWVVESSACPLLNPLCTDARGGVFNSSASKSWQPMGTWQLGLPDEGTQANGDYGLETIVFTNTLNRVSTGVDSAIMAGITDMEFYQGFLGIGVSVGNFSNNYTKPFISQLAESYGTIPSHSYGYTAGAYHMNQTPGSLVLGGHDPLRYVSHDVKFDLDINHGLPLVNLRGITAKVPSLDKAPGVWSSTSQPLLSINDNITAIIDTTTPYLWLPRSVCDRFATALSLTWNETLGVYLYDASSQQFANLVKKDSPLSFTFSVSSYHNIDTYGNPLEVPGVVNITVSSAAFAQLLKYPFKNVIQQNQSSVPYFPLKRANEGGPYIIGRAFMQEAYLITDYERGKISLYQAAFPDNPSTNYQAVTIPRSPDSPYPAYADKGGHGLSTGQTAGIVVSAFVVGSVVGLALWCCCRSRKRRAAKKHADNVEDFKDDTASVEDEPPRSPVKRMLTMMTRRKKSKKPAVHEVPGSSKQPVEVAADANHELYELPVPMAPVELDGNAHHDDDDDTTVLGTEGSEGVSSYEAARKRLERQLRGPVPTYSPSSTTEIQSAEKSAQDISPVAHYRPSDDPSPASSPTYGNTNSLPNSLPSPMTPHGDQSFRHFDFPSPMTVAPPAVLPPFPTNISDPSSTFSSHPPRSPSSTQSPSSSQPPTNTFAPSSLSRSNSSNASPISPTASIRGLSPTYQRTPIDPSRIVCLGPLPENVQLPSQPSLPSLVTSSGPRRAAASSSVSPTSSLDAPSSPHPGRRRSAETLGSNYTVEEERRIEEEMTRQQSHRQPRQEDSQDLPNSPHTLDPAYELVHVPQLADKRYSWEET